MPKAPEISILNAGDYSTLTVEGTVFYFGYEYGKDEEGYSVWGFTATRDGKEVARIAHSDMRDVIGCPEDREECQSNLLFGIGLFLAGVIR